MTNAPKPRKQVSGFATVTENGMGLNGNFNDMLRLVVPNLAGKRVLLTYTELTPELEEQLKEEFGTAWVKDLVP